MHKINSYNELSIWQKSVELVSEMYKITERFPKEGTCGIVTQINQTSVSIPANIAEGWGNETSKGYLNFLKKARRDVMELERLVIMSQKMDLVDRNDFMKMIYKITETNQLLNAVINKRKAGGGSFNASIN